MTQLLSLVYEERQGKEIPSSAKQILPQWQNAIKISVEDSEIPGMDRKKINPKEAQTRCENVHPFT